MWPNVLQGLVSGLKEKDPSVSITCASRTDAESDFNVTLPMCYTRCMERLLRHLDSSWSGLGLGQIGQGISVVKQTGPGNAADLWPGPLHPKCPPKTPPEHLALEPLQARFS